MMHYRRLSAAMSTRVMGTSDAATARNRMRSARQRSVQPGRLRSLGRSRVGVSTLLVGLVLLALLPALGLGLAATWYAIAEQRRAAEQRLSDRTHDIALAIDRQLTGYVDALIAFSSSPSFNSGDDGGPDVPALYEQARRIGAQLGLPLSVIRSDGTRLFHTMVRLGTKLPPTTALGLVRQVVESERPAISDLIGSSILQSNVTIIAVPVINTDGHVAFIAEVGLSAEQARRLLMQTTRPGVDYAELVDGGGRVIARSDALHELLAGKVINADGLAIHRQRSEGSYGAVGLDGRRNLFHFVRLGTAPAWSVVVAEPIAALNAKAHWPTLIFGSATFLVFLLGIALAVLTARSILGPLRRLATHARAIAASAELDGLLPLTVEALPPMYLAELETLRGGFAAAEGTLRQRAAAEQKAAQRASQREAHLRRLFQASPIGLGRAMIDGRITEANNVLLGILDSTQDLLDTGTLHWNTLLLPDGRAAMEHAIATALDAADGRCEPFETEFLRPDGGRVPVMVNCAALEAPEVAVFVIDLSQTRRHEAHLRDLLSTLDLGAFMTRSLDGTIRHWSAGCQRLYGWTAAQALGRNAHELLQTGCATNLAEREAEIMASGAWTGDLRQTTMDGSRIVVTAHKRLDRDLDGTPLVLEMLTDITMQRTTELALAESRAQLSAISDALPDLIFSKDHAGRFLYANPAVLKLLGRAAEEVLGHSGWDFQGNPEEARQVQENDRQVMQTGEPATFLETFTAPGGLQRTFLSIKAPLRDTATGSIIGIAGVSRDVTEQREAEATKAHLALIVESTLDAVVSFAAADGQIMSWNRAAETLFGWTEAEAVGSGVALLLPKWLPEGDPTGVFNAALSGKPIRDFETVRSTKNGMEIPVSITAARLQAPDGTILGVCGIFRDLRPRLRTEAALRDSEARWRTLADSHPGFIFEADRAGRLVYANANFQSYAGVAAAEMLGDGWLKLLHPEDRARAAAAWYRARRSGGVYQAECRFRDAAGHYAWYLCRGVPQCDDRGVVQCWYGACTDITEIVAARESAARTAVELEELVRERTRELEATQQRLVQAAKLEALGRLAGGVAHDFNNVLQAVQGGVALALRRLNGDVERVKSYLTIASEAAERGASVTGRLLAFAHRSELSATAINPVALLGDLAEMLRHTLGPSVAIEVEVADDTPWLFADKAQLETVIVNLANNARDAMLEGTGQIRLVAEAPADVPSQLADGRYVRLAVIDNGSGMSPAVLARVSEPFFTTKPRGSGTGLGLAMARGFAEQSGGVMLIDSEVDRGTTITVWLPAASQEIAVPHQASAVSGSPAMPLKRMLVVDDEPMVRIVIKTVLADLGHEITEAEDAASALHLVDAGAAIDVLITDLAMPGALDGLDLIREARRRKPGLPALLLTGHTGDAGRTALDDASATGPFMMLHKPVSPQTLEAKMELLLRA